MLEAALNKKLRDFPLDLYLQVWCGEILVLMGENGAGKSTVLNLLSGLLAPDTGSIRLNGTDLYKSAAGISVPVEDRHIGYVLQNSAAFPHLTAAGNIAYGMRANHLPKDRIPERVDHWLDAMDIRALAGVKAGSLSGGQKQRVAIARALATEPSLLMLDEPFTGLDTDSRGVIKQLVRTFIAELNIPCIVVTHRISDSRDIADKACVISRGTIQWTGAPDQLENGLNGIS